MCNIVYEDVIPLPDLVGTGPLHQGRASKRGIKPLNQDAQRNRCERITSGETISGVPYR
jgi:hypothetical protein